MCVYEYVCPCVSVCDCVSDTERLRTISHIRVREFVVEFVVEFAHANARGRPGCHGRQRFRVQVSGLGRPGCRSRLRLQRPPAP